MAAVQSRFVEADVDLELNVPDEAVWIDGDPARLQQVQVNLLVNAVKYTPAGGQVSLTLQCEENKALVVVSDNGFGMSPELLPRIFEPFVQADNTLDRADGGMGVGLSLAKSLTQLHGGEIHARSEGPGRGSEFTIRLPLCNANTNVEASAVKAAPRSADNLLIDPPRRSAIHSNSQRLNILLVEDNHQVRDTLSMLLELEGYSLRTAADGLAALEAVSKSAPDVAILDLGLPGLNGFQVAERIRQSYDSEKLYLIALTGYGQPHDQKRSREAGFNLHLTKPVEVEDLKEVFDGLCGEVSINGSLSEPAPDTA
jgi:CheY-like chemotaxis protein/anti-sigma regulatory factor (Ser/Thr protein kinase)